MWLMIAFLLASKVNASMFCSDSLCTTCTKGKKYNNRLCVDRCPVPSSPNASSCSALPETIFSNKFYSVSDYSLTSFNGFNTLGGIPFNSPSRITPIPTVDQGFYFESSSFMNNITNASLSPNFAFRVTGIFKGDGKVFELLCDGISQFKVSILGSKIQAHVRFVNISDFQVKILERTFNNTHWESFSVFINHPSTSRVDFRITTITDWDSIAVGGFEYRPCSGETEFAYGSMFADSFRGFLIESNFVSQGGTFLPFSYRYTCLCDYNQYCNPWKVCVDCNSSCPTWPWCIRESCNVCYSSACDSCSAYDYLSCTNCTNPSLSPPNCMCAMHCTNCTSTFTCTSCESGYILLNTKCMKQPYDYYPGSEKYPVVDYVFRTYEQYKFGLLQSGADPQTWFPYNHSTDDPYIVPNRGLYINSYKLLKTRDGKYLNLNYKFTVGIWVFTTTTNIIDLGNFIMKNHASFSITLTGTDSYRVVNQGHSNQIYNSWIYFSLSVNFLNDITTIRGVLEMNEEIIFSIAGFIYLSNDDKMIISSTGLIILYSITIYQDYVLLNRNNILQNDVKITCNELSYYNSYQKICRSCPNSSKCSSWGTNNHCKYPDCTSCSSWDEECIRNNSTMCDSSSRYTNGLCCNAECSSCFDSHRFACLSCNSSLLLGHACTDACPSQFVNLNSKCSSSDTLLISKDFTSISFEFYDDLGKTKILMGNDSAVFPELNPTHPVPALRRGFYFRKESFLVTEEKRLSYNFTLVFWVRFEGNGNFFRKGDYQVVYEDLYLKVFNFSSTGDQGSFGVSDLEWHFVSLGFWIDLYGNQIVRCRRDNSESSLAWSQGMLDKVLSPMIIGDQSLSFIGFLYRFKAYNSLEMISLPVSFCITSLTLECLSNCTIDTYFNNGNCSSCNNCSYGCVRNKVCELCKDPLCSSCVNFEYGCVNCKPNSTFNGSMCSCDKGFYYNHLNYSCDPCQNNCESCVSLETCFCFAHSHSENLSCVCDEGYWMNSYGDCIRCHKYCYGCLTNEYYRCTSCSNYLLGSVCVNLCPFGYNQINKECIQDPKILILRFKLERLDGVFYDDTKTFRLTHGSDKYFYPHLDKNDPWPAIGRGVYMTGHSALGLASRYPEYFLGIQFSIGLWINLEKDSGIIMSAKNFSTYQIKAFIDSGLIKFQLLLEDYKTATFMSSITTGKWNFLAFMVKYSTETSLALVLNLAQEDWQTFGKTPFNSTSTTKLYFGSSAEFFNGFSGFLYEISLFSGPSDFSIYLNFSENCGFFPVDGECLSFCNISTFPSECFQCSQCEKGCRSKISCNLCEDLNCFECRDYSQGSCVTCNENFRLFRKICVPVCGGSEYFDENLMSCQKCPRLCSSCASSSYCFNCSKNAEVKNDNLCGCEMGFQGYLKCEQVYFYCALTVDLKNALTVIFNESLLKNPSKSDIEIKVNNNSLPFSIYFLNSSVLVITIDFQEDVYQNDQLYLLFSKPIYSKKLSLLSNIYHNAYLFPLKLEKKIDDVKYIESATEKGMLIGAAVSAGMSLMNMDLKSYLNFRNSAEIFSSIILYDIEMSPNITAFLAQIHYSSTLPTFIEKFFDSNSGVKLNQKFIKYGYKTNFILLNSGMYFISFAIFGSFYIIFKLIDLLKSNTLSRKVLEYLEFDAFLKLWLQGYLETTLCSIIGIKNTEFANSFQFIDLVVCFFTLLINFIGIPVLYITINKHYKITDEEEKAAFLKKFGTFFNEFKSDSYCLFYFLFVVRRFAFLLILLLFKSEAVILFLLSIFSVANVFYIIFSQSHIEPFNKGFLLTSECTTVFFYWIMILKFPFRFEIDDFYIISIVSIALSSNIFFIIGKLIFKMKMWIRRRRAVVPFNDKNEGTVQTWPNYYKSKI